MTTKKRLELIVADREQMFLAADGSMMCEQHPGYEWGVCPGGGDCPGPGTPWEISGRTLIDEVASANRDALRAIANSGPLGGAWCVETAKAALGLRSELLEAADAVDPSAGTQER